MLDLNYPLLKSHIDYNFIEPIKYFVPSIGISEIIKANNGLYITSSLKHLSIYTFKLDKNLTYENLLNIPLASIEKITSFLKKLKNEFSIIGFQNPGQKEYFNDLIDTNSSTIDEDMFNLLSSFFKKIEY